MRKLSVALGLLVCMVLGSAAPALAATGSIAGTVTSAATHDPISGVWVCASGHPFPPGGCDNTDVDGKYKIEGLQDGGFTVSFDLTSANYIEATRGAQVVGGAEASGIDAELTEGGRISGRVTDVESGDPIEYVEVCAPRIDDPAEIRTIYCDRTDADGDYMVQALATGQYKIEFGSPSASPLQVNYIRQYYPGKPSWAEAEVRPLTAGTTLPDIDAEMQRGVEVSGTITSDGAPVEWQSRVCALDANSEAIVQCTFPEGGGLYRMAGLPFGSYKVSFGVDVEDEPGLVLHPDGFVPQYYDDKPTFAAADVLGSAGPMVFTDIDARLVRGDDPRKPRPESIAAGPFWRPLEITSPKRPLRCKKGQRKKRVKGKRRCVKVQMRKGRASKRQRQHSG